MLAADTSLFDAAVAVNPAGQGRYDAELRPEFNGPVAPNGGVLAATMLRAAEAELGPAGPPPRTVAAHFLEAPGPEALELEVEVLRRGKRVAFLDVRARQGARLVAQATIVCSAPRPQPVELAPAAPGFAPPETVAPLDFGAIPGAPPVFRSMELRPALGSWRSTGSEDAVTGGWMALRDDDRELDAARLCALTDLWWPAVFGVLGGPAPVPTIQLTVHLRALKERVRPPVWARFETRLITEGHLEERGQLWSRQGRLLAESVQLAVL